ncbi:hypothetical protein EJ357_27560 [Streptomyces cyaneochromogenes]|uniref:Lipoprotein n=1 Tax=Streptomyces cyaneochromogenes TaxID=2496836 RepID=A0A3S9MBY5_9ACTN|nr:hypothetical protein [Streptomyces cyaneochromogenes]AZQ36737.1 hypothetical protein EJ357_27560 [Streptomyces cyaneochromogenes]
MTSTRARRSAFRFALLTALTALAAACTSSGRPDAENRATPSQAVMAALRTVERSTGEAESARVRSTTTMGAELSMKCDGTLAWRDGLTGTLTITYTGGTTAETMRRLGTTSMEARYLPDAYYARMGERFAEKADGKHWIKYAYDDLESLAGSSGAALADQMRGTAPHTSVKLLLSSTDVRKVGEETVRGERTAHYSGTVSAKGAGSQTVDIWVDDRDLLVKKVEKGHTATGGKLTQTAFYSDYGVRTTAEKPPAGDTVDLKDLLEKKGG